MLKEVNGMEKNGEKTCVVCGSGVPNPNSSEFCCVKCLVKFHDQRELVGEILNTERRTTKRPNIDHKKLSYAENHVIGLLNKRLHQKGSGVFASPHEALGIITEEYFELIEAVKSNEDARVLDELADIAVGCLIGMASILTLEQNAKEE